MICLILGFIYVVAYFMQILHLFLLPFFSCFIIIICIIALLCFSRTERTSYQNVKKIRRDRNQNCESWQRENILFLEGRVKSELHRQLQSATRTCLLEPNSHTRIHQSNLRQLL